MRVIFALAAAAGASAVLVERPELTQGWKESQSSLTLSEAVNSDDDFSFHVIVKDQNMDELRSFVEEISDPTNEMYGESMTPEEVSEFTKPSAEDTAAVTEWLEQADGCSYTVDDAGRHVWVTCSVDAAQKLLSTKIGFLVNSIYGQSVVRASDYEIPDEVDDATAAIFGLHGLPIPVVEPLTAAAPGEPVSVTPAVIAKTYGIEGITPKGTTTNRMAVAEFQGQNEEDSDLAAFFKAYVPDAKEGDDKVYKFVGDRDQQEPGVEASLDIQYIMGVAPHIKSEFWLWDNADFCADLENWTSTILHQGAEGPHVHSVSYGWQGNLTQVQCTNDKVSVVDANFVKVAATRQTIIFASGDSGSGYAPPRPNCDEPKKDTQLEGTVKSTTQVPNAEECCFIGLQEGEGYSFVPGGFPTPGATCAAGDIGKKDTAFKGHPVQVLHVPEQEKQVCCQIARRSAPYKPYHFTISAPYNGMVNCSLYSTVTSSFKSKGAYSGLPGQPVAGECKVYSKVTGSSHASNVTSGSSTAPSKVQLYPSWPASSPYVTAVGATRFIDQDVSKPEMASDQFGSGGGFSDMFDQTHAKWQVEAVAEYTNNPPKNDTYPPAGSFNPKGRATPDISALGEGYMVYTGGHAQPVGGTSASTPAFAGMVALLNEAREQDGKPALGFLNPFIYQNADCFTDVTVGTNAIGRGTGPIKYGFPAAKGWDPATGLGTPKFGKLLEAAKKV